MAYIVFDSLHTFMNVVKSKDFPFRCVCMHTQMHMHTLQMLQAYSEANTAQSLSMDSRERICTRNLFSAAENLIWE